MGTQQDESLVKVVSLSARVPWVVLAGPLTQRSLSIASLFPLGESVSLARSCGTVLRPILLAV